MNSGSSLLVRGRLMTYAGLAVLGLAGGAGCQQLAAMVAVTAGGETTPAEYKFTEGQLAILIDDTEQLGMSPDAMRMVHDDIARRLEEHKIKVSIIPYSELQRLRAAESDFEEMSIRLVGEKLGADQVLYVDIKYWALKENPNDQYFKGSCSAGIRVCSTERKRDVRLWPSAPNEHDKTVTVKTDPRLDDAGSAESEISRQLAGKLAARIAQHFYSFRPMDEPSERASNG